MLAEPSPRQLEDAIARRQGGAPVAEAVGIHPAAEELEGMLALSEELGALTAAAPGPEVRARARDEFEVAGRAHRAAWVHRHALPHRKSRHPLPTHRFRWGFVLAVALTLALVAGVTLALASQLAEPDSSLYPLKMSSERLLVAVNRAPTSKASIHLQLANQRFRDAEAMAASGKGSYAVSSIRAYYDQLRLAARELARGRHDAAWKTVRNQFDAAEAKPIDVIITQLQNNRQMASVDGVKAAAAQFSRDRKTIDTQLNPAAATGGGQTPAPLPSGAQPQPGATTP